MRKIFPAILTLIIVFITSCGGHDYKDRFAFSPVNPSPGDDVTVYYNPSETSLADADQIDLVVYLYNTDIEDAIGINMLKDGKGWKGEFSSSETTYGVVVKFKSGEQEDSNNKKGYWIDLYTGGGLVPGLLAGKANIYSFHAHNASVDRDFNLSNKYFMDAFEKFPETKKEHLDNYLSMLNRSKFENYESTIKAELNIIDAQDKIDEADMAVLANWYGRFGENDKAEKYKAELLSINPKGEFAQENLVSAINNESEIGKKIELLKEFELEYPENQSIPGLYNSIARAYGNANQFEEAKSFMSDNIEMISTYRFYSIANSITDQDGDNDLALEIAKMGMIRGQQDLDSPKEPKPNDATIDEWETDRKYYLALNMYKYGNILYGMGKREEILPILDEAINLSIDYYIPQELINLYAKTIVESKKFESALARLGGFIENGKNSEDVMNALKEAYIHKNGSEEGFVEYLGQYEEAAEMAMLAKLKKEMINNPSVPFTLKDLDGNEVSLADFKGKIVILDFWATWCPPCKASFPGMKIAVEKYAHDDEVKFLFVDTWERVSDKKKNAADFIKQHNYPFHVLLDDDYKVIGAYKVPSIPTKFILDKEGNVRFRNAGYSGNIEHLVKEIDLMIDLLKEI